MTEKLSGFRTVLLGLFVVLAGGLAITGVFAVASHEWLFADTFTLRAAFPSIGGVQQGSRVRVRGIDAGLVEKIAPPTKPGDPVVLHLRVDETYRKLIRKDAVASLATQGIIGMKVVEIDPGTEKSARVEDGDAINSQAPIELSQVLSDAYDTGQELRAMGRKLDGMLTRMDEITAQVQEGKGTLGQLVMTDDAHRAAMELMQSGDQMVTTLDESMIAVRRVWPLRDYFIGQGMTNPDELLFRPNATRQVRTYASSKLFEPGRSVITAEGKRMLDATAAWLKGITDQDSEIVIAAFDSEQDNDLRAQRLTQEQANAARDYLVNIHTVNKLGFFARRKVVAAGFGRGENELDAENNLSRSVTVVVFIPDQ